MDIDLSKVIGYSRDSLQSRALMRSIMLDLYPGKTREMNVLLDVYESGVPRKIKNDGNITDAKYAQYIQKIIDDYGMQEQWAVVGLNAWIDVCLGKGTAATIKYRVVTVPSNGGNASNGNTVGGGYTNPIVHNNSAPVNNTPVQGNASDYEIADLGNGTIEIKKFVGFDQADTIIPTEINGKKVVSIGSNAYKQCKGIRRLIVPEGITKIDDGAFAECSSLCEIMLPSTLVELGRKNSASSGINGPFSGTAIEKIDLPNGIKRIGYGTFCNCDRLREVLLPDNLQIISTFAFLGCSTLEKILLPSTVKEIESHAFSRCSGLQVIQLNEGLVKIGSNAFAECNKVLKLLIPSTITEIGSEAFKRSGYSYRGQSSPIILCCYPGSRAIEYARLNNLGIEQAMASSSSVGKYDPNAVKPIVHKPIVKNDPVTSSGKCDFDVSDFNGGISIDKYNGFDQSEFTIPEEINGKKVLAIGRNAFKACKGINRIVVPEGVIRIDDGAFSDCSGLREVWLPSTLSELGQANSASSGINGPFSGTAIEKIDLPNGIKRIGYGTFCNCDRLREVLLPDNLQTISTFAFLRCTALEKIALPVSMRVIESHAFSGCSNLQDLQLNEGLKEIGSNAFAECTKVDRLLIPSTVEKIGSEAFKRNGFGLRNQGKNITLRCYPGSKAIEYARLNNLGIEQA